MEQSLKSQVFQRLSRDGRWSEASLIKDRLIREARQRGMARDDAHEAAYRTIDAMFPPADRATPSNVAKSTCEGRPDAVQADELQTLRVNTAEELGDNNQQPREEHLARLGDNRFLDGSQPAATTTGESRGRGESTVAGLSEIPSEWPQLPPNASLGAEVAWVLANRIRVIREDSDGAVVDLSKALTPAPSYAALGWLETSIRAFAKFVDVSARASASGQDDADKIKRERIAIAEIRSLLEQMRQEA
jgi:hypothetical protein